MMNNLFSIFDTSTNTWIDLNWISSLLFIFLLPMKYWIFDSRILKFTNNFINIMFKEFKIILQKKFNSFNIIFYISGMLMIFINNFMGLYPYIFTSSSHLIFAVSFSLPMWIALMLFSWLNNYNFMFSHMIPLGTPFILMPFMVLIETISNIIRPLTLAIRLTANMIAGHLLITLLSESSMSNFLTFLIASPPQIILLALEMSVSIIQAYVFTILSVLYASETNYE